MHGALKKTPIDPGWTWTLGEGASPLAARVPQLLEISLIQE